MVRLPRLPIFTVAAAAALATTAAGCKNKDDMVDPAGVQFINVSVDSTGFDVYDQVDTTNRTLLFTGLARESSSGFITVDAGSHRFTISPVGGATELLELLPSLTGNRNHTVVVYDAVDALRGIVTLDPTNGLVAEIRFRAFHAAPNVGTVTVLIDLTTGTTGPLYSNLAVGAVSTLQELPPSAYRIYLDLDGNDAVSAADLGYDLPPLAAGEYADLVIADSLLADPYVLFIKSDGAVVRINPTP